jgi:LRR receptor-like serine/threonine-protein kinase FLS2
MDGTIPAEFGKLSNTLTLDLSDNDIKGELPEFHQNLRYILCGKNALAGTIPESITQLTNLHGLDLSMNRLEGKLPDNFGDLEELRSLMLSENLFSGSFPEIPKMLKMTKLHVDDNLFTGSLPTYIEEFTRLSKFVCALVFPLYHRK